MGTMQGLVFVIEFPGMSSRSAKALGLFSQASSICDLWVVGLLIFFLDTFLSR